MKHAAILTAVLALAPGALAGDDPDDHDHHHHKRTFYFSAGAGGIFGGTVDEGESPIFDQGVDIDDGLILEARVGFAPIPWLELEGSVSFAPSEFVVEGDTGLFGTSGEVSLADVDIWHYTVNANFHFLPREDFDPFFTLGLGAATYNIDARGIDADTKFALVIGSGFTYWFGDAVGFRADVRDYVTVLDVDNDYDYDCDCYYDYDAESDTIHNVSAVGSLALRWH